MLARLCSAARVALAGLMFVGSFNMLLYTLRPSLFPPLHPFMQTLVASGYLLVPKLLELLGGALLLTRYRALGLTLLWPVIVNIALFHAFIDERQWYNAPLLVVLAALASWPERAAWAPLVRPRALLHRASFGELSTASPERVHRTKTSRRV